MTDAEIFTLAARNIKWVEPQHALFYDDALLSFARAIAAQLAAQESNSHQTAVKQPAPVAAQEPVYCGYCAFPIRLCKCRPLRHA